MGSVLANSIDLIDQLIMYVLYMYSFHTSVFLQTYCHYIPLLLMNSPPTLAVGEYLNFVHMHTHITFPYLLLSSLKHIMAVHMNDGHIIYYHMDATLSMDLTYTYFINPIWLSSVGSNPHHSSVS